MECIDKFRYIEGRHPRWMIMDWFLWLLLSWPSTKRGRLRFTGHSKSLFWDDWLSSQTDL